MIPTEHCTPQQQVDSLTQELIKTIQLYSWAMVLLDRLEWCDVRNGIGRCAECGNSDTQGHKEDCHLGLFIDKREVPPEIAKIGAHRE